MHSQKLLVEGLSDFDEAIEELRAAKAELETAFTPEAGPIAAFHLMRTIVHSHDRIVRAITILNSVMLRKELPDE